MFIVILSDSTCNMLVMNAPLDVKNDAHRRFRGRARR